ncbi:MAG: glycine cleavage system aminomethyltransferase GcvT [Clostridiaceae bacterium]|nr:glycine cleavage system aminomethyltransferase GcvT [Clostridiaceae bacterium]
MKRTVLHETHSGLGAKMAEFAGWLLPTWYSGIIEEHERVRKAAGIFDVSHMGEIMAEGPDAGEFIQKLVTNNIENMKTGRARYSPMCYPNGGTVDDILIYKLSDTKYLLVVNAANTEKDFNWMKSMACGRTEIKDVSGEYALLAVQGPRAVHILKKMTDFPLESMKPFDFVGSVPVAGVDCMLSRTGYTGEDGFELFVSPWDAKQLWDKILEEGKDEGLVPAGLGARDTLRLEAAMPLYGHELSEDITPLEAGLERFVKFDKGDFTGRDALLKQKEEGLSRQLTGFEMLDSGIPRNGHRVQVGDEVIGFVTSGSFIPTMKKNVGMALLKRKYCKMGTEIEVVVRNKTLKARITKLPFYTRKGE